MTPDQKKTLQIYFALLILLALTVGVNSLHLGKWSAPASLLIASTKAALILAYFMQLRRSPVAIRIFALGALLWLFFMLLLTSSDYLTRF